MQNCFRDGILVLCDELISFTSFTQLLTTSTIRRLKNFFQSDVMTFQNLWCNSAFSVIVDLTWNYSYSFTLLFFILFNNVHLVTIWKNILLFYIENSLFSDSKHDAALRKDGASRSRSKSLKDYVFDIETEETRHLSNSQLQRLVLLEQLEVLRLQRKDLIRKIETRK